MYFVLKSLNFIYIIPLYIFRTPLCPSSGASQLHMQSLVPINYKNTCILIIDREQRLHVQLRSSWWWTQWCPKLVERNNVNKILRILKQITSSWRFHSSYYNDVRNHEPETHRWLTHAATYCVIIRTQRMKISGRNSNGTKQSGGPPEDGREKRLKHVGVLYLQKFFNILLVLNVEVSVYKVWIVHEWDCITSVATWKVRH